MGTRAVARLLAPRVLWNIICVLYELTDEGHLSVLSVYGVTPRPAFPPGDSAGDDYS
jgi:hypothetical protein